MTSIPRAPTAPGHTYCGKCERATPFANKDANFVEPNLPPIALNHAALVKYFNPERFTVSAEFAMSRNFALKALQIRVAEEDVNGGIKWHVDNSPNYQYVRDNYAPADVTANPLVFVRTTPIVTTPYYCIECYNSVMEKERTTRQKAAEESARDAKMIAVVTSGEFYNRSYRLKPFGSKAEKKRTRRIEDAFDYKTCTNCIKDIGDNQLYVGAASDPETNLCMDCFAVYHRKKYTRAVPIDE